MCVYTSIYTHTIKLFNKSSPQPQGDQRIKWRLSASVFTVCFNKLIGTVGILLV